MSVTELAVKVADECWKNYAARFPSFEAEDLELLKPTVRHTNPLAVAGWQREYDVYRCGCGSRGEEEVIFVLYNDGTCTEVDYGKYVETSGYSDVVDKNEEYDVYVGDYLDDDAIGILYFVDRWDYLEDEPFKEKNLVLYVFTEENSRGELIDFILNKIEDFTTEELYELYANLMI